jgi:hypothetical protein
MHLAGALLSSPVVSHNLRAEVMLMPVNLRVAVIETMNELRKTISEKSSEVAELKRELERYKSVLTLLSQTKSEDKLRVRNGRRRSGGDLDAVLGRLPTVFRSRDFMRAASRAGKSSVYLRQILSRWARRGKIKRLEKGKYRKLKRTSVQRMAA